MIEPARRRTVLADGGDLPPILDAAQVAEMLGMNVQMVRRYAREGRLPAYKLPGGRTFRFFRDEIFDHLRRHPAVAGSEEASVVSGEET
jgi:excisionase family DNA binding protein